MTPEEMEKLPKPLERIMTALELSVMAEVVERIRNAAEITPLIDWKLSRLAKIGTSRSRIRKMIEDALKDSELQIDDIYNRAVESDYARHKELYDAAGRDCVPYKENPWLQQVVGAVKQQTKDSLRPMENITQTTGFNVMLGKKRVFTPLSEYLERSLDKSMMGIASGTHTYSQAINEVIQEMTNSGLRVVDYASGKSDRIEVAARRAVMTGVAQMVDKVNEHNAEQLGTDHWEVDWHMGARNTGTGYRNHQSWQGKEYDGKGMKEVCGLGEMLGFAGINCYHIRFPFIPGISKRKYTDEWLEEQNRKENEKKTFRGKKYDTYGALQYQRKLERTIRKQKQDILLLEKAGADKDDIVAAKSRRRVTEKTYVDFSKEIGLRQQRERLTIPKVQPAAAEAIRNTNTKVEYNPNNDYTVKLPGHSDEVNRGLSKAIESVAIKGTQDGNEHMHLVDLKSGSVTYYETNGQPGEVGYDFWKFLKKYPGETFAFVHNHNVDSSFSEPDIRTLLRTPEISMMVAARNDGVKYIAEKGATVPNTTWYDDLYQKEIDVLNKAHRDGKITSAERSLQRELLIVDNLLRDYTKGGKLIEYDGRK